MKAFRECVVGMFMVTLFSVIWVLAPMIAGSLAMLTVARLLGMHDVDAWRWLR